MTEGLDLHLGVDTGAGFVGRSLETALREAIRSGRHRDVLHAAGLATVPLEAGPAGRIRTGWPRAGWQPYSPRRISTRGEWC